MPSIFVFGGSGFEIVIDHVGVVLQMLMLSTARVSSLRDWQAEMPALQCVDVVSSCCRPLTSSRYATGRQ